VYVVGTANNNGAQITEALPNGLANLTGLHPGDVINAIDGKPIRTPMELAADLSSLTPGTSVKLGFLISGQWQSEATITLGSH